MKESKFYTKFVERLSEELSVPADLIRTHLENSPVLETAHKQALDAVAGSYYANILPEEVQEQVEEMERAYGRELTEDEIIDIEDHIANLLNLEELADYPEVYEVYYKAFSEVINQHGLLDGLVKEIQNQTGPTV